MGNWTPATLSQGFLSGRWQRRDGTVYGVSGRANPGPNSPIEGGDDADAKVDVSSGAPIAEPTKHPTGNIRPSVSG